MISGEVTIDSASTSRTVTIKNSFRIGYTFYSGVEYLISNSFGLNFGVKLTNANQVLKASDDNGSTTEVSLRDKRVDPKIYMSGFKNFVYVSMYLGVNLYFGIKDVAYKF
jgi:outer membrane protein W